MNKIRNDFVQNSQCLQKKVHDIAEMLGHTPMTQNKFHATVQE